MYRQFFPYFIDVLPTNIEAGLCVNNVEIPVNSLSTSSSNEKGEVSFPHQRYVPKNVDEEAIACESWDKKSKRQRKSNSYLLPITHLRHKDLTRSRNIQSLTILENGSRAEELKAFKISELGQVVLSNTCTFDTITSITMAAICDSLNYSTKVDSLKSKNILLEFVESIIKNGIRTTTSVKRANLIVSTYVAMS